MRSAYAERRPVARARIMLVLPEDELTDLDGWAVGAGIETRSAALRRLLKSGLRAEPPSARGNGSPVQRHRTDDVGASVDRYWIEVGQHHKGDGARNTRWSLDYLNREIGRDVPLMAIRPSRVAEIVARRRGDGVAATTVNRSVTEPLRKVLRKAADVWDQTVPKIDWRLHMLPEPNERVRELSADEEARLLAEIRPDYQPLFRFSLASGVRRAGCLALRWSDIDWGNRIIRVQGKGGNNYTIPLSVAMREILWPLQGRHPYVVFTYVVQRTREGRRRGECLPITEEGLKTEFSRAREAAGLPSTGQDGERGYRWHDNRHTRATRLVRRTGNLKMAQKLLGHQRIETTAKYAHVTMNDLMQALDAETGIATGSPGISPGTALALAEDRERDQKVSTA